MISLATHPALQLIIGGIGLIELILALYILALNSKHTANRHVSALFLLFAVNSFAIGWLVGADTITEGHRAAAILSATTPIFGFANLITAIVLIKPIWVYGRWRWLWFAIYGLSALPFLLTILDLIFGTQIWYIGLNQDNFTGGFLALSEYTNPELSLIRTGFLIGIPTLAFLPLTYLSFFDKRLAVLEKRLARLLLIGQLAATLLQIAVSNLLPRPIPSILTSTFYFTIYAYASFSHLISERRLQSGRLQSRLTIVVLVISIPLLFFTPSYLFNQTSSLIRQDAIARLEQKSTSVSSTVDIWLGNNIKALEQLVSLPDIASMDPLNQKPILESMAATYPYMYLVSTTNISGVNVARSDGQPPKDYSDRVWFHDSVNGAEISQQTLIGRTSGQPAIVLSKPIHSKGKEIVGVGMFATDINTITDIVSNVQLSDTGNIFVVDSENLVVAHTDPTFAYQLADFSYHPAVVTMRSLSQENIRYRDQDGTTWIATFQELENGWGVIVEQSEAELLISLHNLQIATWVTIVLGALLLGALTGLAVRQAIAPINSLTETATAITDGDLSRVAPIESEDEIGFLAQTFNQMTEQLLDLIGGLERRVSERTKELEKRSIQLEAAAQVGRAASSILEVDELFNTTVELIRSRFGLYYVGLFLVDEAQEFAVLKAGTGEAGKTMLTRQHKIRIGEGMIGWSVANGQPRVAQEAGEDAVRLATRELPKTRSEAAIPLRTRDQVIGAISAQSSRVDTFDSSTVTVLETLADLVSVAIDNARLYTESKMALESTRRAYSERSHEDWLEILQKRSDISFRSNRDGISSAIDIWTPEMRQAWILGNTIITETDNGDEKTRTLTIPIKVRGNVIGVIKTHKSDQEGKWSDQEQIMLEAVVEQLGVALDGARLYEETQIQANNERMISEITSRIRETLDIESVLQTTALELRNALHLAEVEIRLGQDSDESSQIIDE